VRSKSGKRIYKRTAADKWSGRCDVVYCCPQNTFRGASVCKNSVRLFRRALEERLLSGLQEQIMRPEAVEYILDNFEGQLVKALDNLGGELECMHRRKQELEREVNNLAQLVAPGDFSPALRAALVDREREIGDITAKLLEARPDSLRVKLHDIRSFVLLHMRDIRAIVNFDVAQTLAIIAKHIDNITMTHRRALRSFRDLELRGARQYRWCRRPESNWLRPPFQGGALPLSYPGTEQILETHSVRVKLSIKLIILAPTGRIRASSFDSSKLRAAWCLLEGPRCRLFP